MATTPVIHPLRLNWHHELTRRFYTSDIPNTLTPKAMHYQRLFEECFFLRHENDVFRGTRRPNPLDILSGRDIGVIIHFIDARIGALEVEVEVLRRENRWLRGVGGAVGRGGGECVGLGGWIEEVRLGEGDGDGVGGRAWLGLDAGRGCRAGELNLMWMLLR